MNGFGVNFKNKLEELHFYGLDAFPQNSYVDIVSPKVMVLGGATLGGD